jgi:hypothetical protein
LLRSVTIGFFGLIGSSLIAFTWFTTSFPSAIVRLRLSIGVPVAFGPKPTLRPIFDWSNEKEFPISLYQALQKAFEVASDSGFVLFEYA